MIEKGLKAGLEWVNPIVDLVLCGSDALNQAGVSSVSCCFGRLQLFPIFSQKSFSSAPGQVGGGDSPSANENTKTFHSVCKTK